MFLRITLLKRSFALTAVNTKVFVLLLTLAKPKSLLSAAEVDLNEVLVSCNRTEFHHIFPKNHLATKEGVTERAQQFMLANFAFLSQKDNRSIQDKAPSDYVKLMPPGGVLTRFLSQLISPRGNEYVIPRLYYGKVEALGS